MQPLLRPVPILTLLIGLTCFLVGQPAAAGVCLFAWVGSLALGSMRQGAHERNADPTDGLAPDERARFVAVRRLVAEIEELIERRAEAPLVQAIGNEARGEARRVRDQVSRALRARTELRRASRERPGTISEVESLEQRIAAATSEEERRALSGALDARRQELAHYEEVDRTLAKIDDGVRMAEAALSEIKARLAVGTSADRETMTSQGDELRATILRLKAVRASYDEVQEILGP